MYIYIFYFEQWMAIRVFKGVSFRFFSGNRRGGGGGGD